MSSDIRASVVTPLSPKDPPLQPHQCGTSRSEGQHAVLIHPDGADPWAASDGGFIYYTQTTGADVQLWVSHELQAIRHSSSFQLWCPYEHERLRLNNLWAPELHYLHGAWYLYVAADDGRNHNHRMYVLESCRGPAGPFKLKGKLSPPHQDRWAIDGTVTFIKGELYYAWSGWPSSRNGRQNLYLAKMDNPWTLTRHMSCISTPQYKWESWINEGPQFLHRGSDTFLVYSANKSWTDDYKLGLLSLQGADPLSPSSWVKRPDPIFDSAHHGEESIHAPGHCSFFTDKHGENWLLYHVAKTKGSGWEREVRAQRWIWGDNGEPHFGRPLPIKRSHPELASVLFDIKCR